MRLFFEELLIGFEFKNFLIALAALLIVYLAWESTYVRDYRVQPNAVLIIDNNRRVLLDIGTHRQDLNSRGDGWRVESVESVHETNDRPSEGNTAETNNRSAETNTVQIPEPPPSLEVVIEEVHDLASVRQQLNENAFRTLESFEEGISGLLNDHERGPEQVIRAMDTTEGLRRRRLAYYNQDRPSTESEELSSEPSTSTSQGGDDSSNTSPNPENSSDRKNDYDNQPKVNDEANKDASAEKTYAESPSDKGEKKEEIRIKLKYLNDDMKLVKGCPSENIGDFKKRNFTLELDAQKFVRLVFNGHVLQPDSKTLEACGLFDNCVVHCLVHNRNPSAANQSQHTGHPGLGQGQNTFEPNTSVGSAAPPNTNGPAVGNFSTHESNSGHVMATYAGIAFISLSLIFCWYCRIQYHVFFTWYSTLVLILVTILFSILGPLLVFIENDEGQPQTT